MPSAAAYTSKLRSLASAKNVKIQYPGGVSDTYRPDRTLMCTNYTATAVDPLKQTVSTIVGPETLTSITSVAVDSAGNIYMLDTTKLCIFQLNPITTTVTVFAGSSGIKGNGGDGGYATSASFVEPTSIAIDSADNLLVCDSGFNRIRKISAGSGIISAFAGTGDFGYSGNGGQASAATFKNPKGISVDPYGNVFVADTGNNVIRRIDALTGIINTVAGNGLEGLAGDCNTATISELRLPTGVVADSAGNIFISDTGNSLVRVVNTAGIISTLAGSTTSGVGIPVGLLGYAGDGDFSIYSVLNRPTQLALDSTGNLFFSDTGNNVIRRISSRTKIITTYAGSGIATYGGDGSVLSVASFNAPTGLTIGRDGAWYIADSGNVRVRKALPGTQAVYAPPWFTPIGYRVLREGYNPVTKSILTYCDCPNFATYEPTYEIIPPNKCLGAVILYGGSATDFSTTDDLFCGSANGINGVGAYYDDGGNPDTTARFRTRTFFGGDAVRYVG